ncbi:dTDP-4-dehydrorhamnose 3,5-epimerase [Aquimarina addita]|uniref:dTDP-4-dehydrorhamnose 3,5-epimerase n=1 Tax=Aquimarina addita TaxID=870485 RepID=A0ABP7XB23_9FLAO
MEIIKTCLDGCFILKPKVFKDERGAFFESFHKITFEKLTGMQIDFVQDNQSVSFKGTVRGLHFQTGKYAQAKLVRVIEGEVLDVAVDIRPTSTTYGKHIAVILNHNNNNQLFVPRGFAHGFITLSEKVILGYKCDNYYNKDYESGIFYDDPELNIDWKLDNSEIILSKKDRKLKFFNDLF